MSFKKDRTTPKQQNAPIHHMITAKASVFVRCSLAFSASGRFPIIAPAKVQKKSPSIVTKSDEKNLMIHCAKVMAFDFEVFLGITPQDLALVGV